MQDKILDNSDIIACYMAIPESKRRADKRAAYDIIADYISDGLLMHHLNTDPPFGKGDQQAFIDILIEDGVIFEINRETLENFIRKFWMRTFNFSNTPPFNADINDKDGIVTDLLICRFVTHPDLKPLIPDDIQNSFTDALLLPSDMTQMTISTRILHHLYRNGALPLAPYNLCKKYITSFGRQKYFPDMPCPIMHALNQTEKNAWSAILIPTLWKDDIHYLESILPHTVGNGLTETGKENLQRFTAVCKFYKSLDNPFHILRLRA